MICDFCETANSSIDTRHIGSRLRYGKDFYSVLIDCSMVSSLMARVQAASSLASTETKSNGAPACAESKASHVPPSIIEQLLQNSSNLSKFVAPPSFFMCSEAEALDRQSCLELSQFEYQPTSNDLQNTPSRNSADATWDANEISLDFSPTPKKSSLASAALPTPPKSSYYSKHSSQSAYVPPNKRVTDNIAVNSTTSTPDVKSNAFNATPLTSTAKKASRTRPNFHPQLVVKKYRRSAAGGGVNERMDSMRSLDQLNGTVNYLMEIFARQMPPNIFAADDAFKGAVQSDIEQKRFSLCETVNFIDDRLRAVQKDLVALVGDLEDPSCNTGTLRNNAQTKTVLRQMQAKMVRYNMLALYLLSDAPPDKYQVKFGTVALRTCLTSYLNLSRNLEEECDKSNDKLKCEPMAELKTKDEIMSYVALFHMSAVLRSEESALPSPSASSASSLLMEESGSGWGALFSTLCKYSSASERSDLLNITPRWKWTLDLAASVQSGNYQHYFSLLKRGPVYQQEISAPIKPHVASDNARFLILARCCCSSSLNLIRLSQLRRYNHSFGKGEKVPIQNIARLLHFNNDKSAVEFCCNAGLPIVNEDPSRCYVTMKAAPINVAGEECISKMCRDNDMFVFGTKFKDGVSLLANKLHRVDIDESFDNWEERDSNAIPLDDEQCTNSEGRLDDDNVMIPNNTVLWKLVE